MRLVIFAAVALGILGVFFISGSSDGDPVRLLILGGWLAFLLAGLLGSGYAIGGMVRDLAIWAAIFLALTTAYVFRYDAQDFASRLTGGLLPGSPVAALDADGNALVTLVRSPNGHFEADAEVNGERVRFLIDTGASDVVLSYRTAQRIGIPVDDLSFSIITRTANGTGRSANARLDSLKIGGIERSNITASVASEGALGGINLLGQSFLESLAGYEKRGDRFTLRD